MSTDDKEAGVGAVLALFGAAALAWGWLLTGAGLGMDAMDMGAGDVMPMPAEWSARYTALVLAMWAVMMVAMMLPGAANAILGSASRPAFAAAYLAVWAAFSLVAALAQFALDRSDMLSEGMALRDDVAAGLVMLSVGLYELTPAKHACLRRCTAPAARGEGAMQSLRQGLVYGLNCLGCCWALMALLFVAGLMNLFWVAAIALWLTAEKLLPFGRRIAQVAGAALAAWGGTLLVLAVG